ncbi:hypothetical protein V6N11_076652 [Hibiscus sabdariffa]|uniref:Uncharacterized protein n=1 Tax=Hibiscus sabdariffa TaxID=183260 RepID=A0ABR2A3B7_9ROSI
MFRHVTLLVRGVLQQNIEYLAYLEPGFSLDGGLRNLGAENDGVGNNDVGPNVGETEVVGLVGVENNEYGLVLGEIEAVGPVGIGNNEDGPVMGETEVARHVLEETEAIGPLYEDTDFVGPVVGERDDENNVGSDKVGRFVNADSNDITTDIAESDEDDDRIESSVEDESSDTGYIESDDLGSYETNFEGELCVKKCKKLFFDDKGEVTRIELGMIFESSKQFKKALGAYDVAK